MESVVVACPSCGKKNRVPNAAKGIPRCASCHEELPWIVDASDSDFDEVTATSPVPVVVDLWAPWCGPCRMVSPILQRLASELAGKMKLVKVNVDHSPKVAARFDARSIPTLVVLDHGKLVSRQIGAAPYERIKAWVESALSGTNPKSSH